MLGNNFSSIEEINNSRVGCGYAKSTLHSLHFAICCPEKEGDE
jgi:hypothetical protein